VGGANFTSAQKNSPYSNRMSHQVKVNSRAPEQMFSSTVSNRESVKHKNGDSSTSGAKLEEVEKKLSQVQQERDVFYNELVELKGKLNNKSGG